MNNIIITDWRPIDVSDLKPGMRVRGWPAGRGGSTTLSLTVSEVYANAVRCSTGRWWTAADWDVDPSTIPVDPALEL